MSGFTRTAAVKRAVLRFPARLSAGTHASLVTGILSNPFGFGKVKAAGVRYVCLIRMETVSGRLAGTICIETPVAGSGDPPYGYEGLIRSLRIPPEAFPGAVMRHDEADDLFSARFACGNETEIFSLVLDRDNMEISGYEDDAIVAAVAAWANMKTACGGDGDGDPRV